MLPVSAEWKNAIKAQFRRQAYFKFTLEVAPPGLRDNAVVTSPATNSLSNPDTIMDHSEVSPQPYFSFEPNRGVLDGTMKFVESSTVTADWWSGSSNSPATIHFEFDQTYSVPGLYIEWDMVSYSHPTSVTIIGYGTDNNELYHFDVDDISSNTGFIEAVMGDIKSVDLVINSWVNPDWLYRINEVTFGLYATFTSENNGRISSVSVSSKAQPLADSLPEYDVSLTFRNVDQYFDPKLETGVSPYLAQRQLGKYQWGFTVAPGVVQWTDDLPIYINDFDIPEDSKDVTLNLTNRLSLLDTKFQKNTYTGSVRTMYDIATYILQNSPFILDFDGQEPWILDESMKNAQTVAPILKEDIATLLQYIALACGTWLTIDVATGYVKFYKPDDSAQPTHEVGTLNEFGDPAIEIKDRLRSITIAVYKYELSSESKNVGKGEYNISGTATITLEYNVAYAHNVTAEVSGATLQSAQYFASYAVVTVTAVLTGATVTITLTGQELVQNVSYVETYRDDSITYGQDVVIENPLVTSSNDLTSLSEYIKKYYTKRTRYTAPYSGFPELEATDKIDFTTVYGNSVVEITENTIDFDGGWSGTLGVI